MQSPNSPIVPHKHPALYALKNILEASGALLWSAGVTTLKRLSRLF